MMICSCDCFDEYNTTMNFENIDKIEFAYLGKYRMVQQAWGRTGLFVLKCPSCRAETTFYRRKGVLKIKCDRCTYEMVMPMQRWVSSVVPDYDSESMFTLLFDKIDVV